ncbi:MAG: DUF4276 family protein [Bacteroidia bacterium]
MVQVTIISEGAKELRTGFGVLFRNIFKNHKIKILQLGPKAEAIKRFKKRSGMTAGNFILLIDLDAPITKKEQQLAGMSLSSFKEDVFFMVQEMEAWFLSQPEVLTDHWGEDLFGAYRNKDAMIINNPAAELQRITKRSRHGTYHKISDGSILLGMIDPERLEVDFPDFKELAKRIKG